LVPEGDGKHQRNPSERPARFEGGAMRTSSTIPAHERAGPTDAGHAGATARATGQTAAAVVGAVFLLVGLLGFVPGVTTDATDIHGAGHDSPAKILGVFAVSVLHNVVHLVFGALGLVAARTLRWSALYLAIGGMIYLALAAYGAVIGEEDAANFLPVNTADDFLHLGLGLVMVILGALAGRELDRRGGRDQGRIRLGR
jgi:hypothetical protein